jgi:outer membrane protein TolC
MVKKVIGYGLIIFGLFFGEVQAAEKLDLATCLRRAYLINHLLKASEWQVASAREQLKATEARRWPEVSFNSLYTPGRESEQFLLFHRTGCPAAEIHLRYPQPGQS